ncbi:hypothetical protein CEP54_008407 [Fusarium duplospermum]|uniref:Uncharacterized protein n=1 Tax=Fusarium duplospermum TaxID=1325734 RepID=A0A428PW66_9HYPO|nr:hypothetical protein CEP54_008407 [Fusarium duplospermum]
MSQPESLYLPPSPPSSIKTDPAATDGSCDNMNSPPARSTAGSQVSLTGGQFIANSNISASPQSLPLESSRQPPVSSPNSYSSTTYLSSSAAESSYLPTPASQPYSPFPVLTPAGLNSSWSQTDQLQSDSGSSLRQQQGGTSLQPLTSDSRQTERSSDMRPSRVECVWKFDDEHWTVVNGSGLWNKPLATTAVEISDLEPATTIPYNRPARTQAAPRQSTSGHKASEPNAQGQQQFLRRFPAASHGAPQCDDYHESSSLHNFSGSRDSHERTGNNNGRLDIPTVLQSSDDGGPTSTISISVPNSIPTELTSQLQHAR